MSGKDPLAIGLGALGCGIGLGGACITLAQVVVELLQTRLDPASYRAAVPDPLLAGLLGGIAIGVFFGWRRSHALENVWQRGVIGVLAAVGALLVGFVAAPVDRFFGIAGLLVWGALSAGSGLAGGRWAMKGSGEQRTGSGTA